MFSMNIHEHPFKCLVFRYVWRLKHRFEEVALFSWGFFSSGFFLLFFLRNGLKCIAGLITWAEPNKFCKGKESKIRPKEKLLTRKQICQDTNFANKRNSQIAHFWGQKTKKSPRQKITKTNLKIGKTKKWSLSFGKKKMILKKKLEKQKMAKIKKILKKWICTEKIVLNSVSNWNRSS